MVPADYDRVSRTSASLSWSEIMAKKSVVPSRVNAATKLSRAKNSIRRVNLTLGDLIAATFDIAGRQGAPKILASADFAAATGRRIIFV